ncbi:MAG: TolC family protein [Sedimentisphaerales bacterium]|nr:TolC family protein [Sedimentisphaerales bacterium]
MKANMRPYCFSKIRFSITFRFKSFCIFTLGLFTILFHVISFGSPGNNEPANVSPPSVIYLHELEPKINTGPNILLAVAELEESIGRLNQIEAESGLQAFAGSEVGRFREATGNDYFREYNQLNLKAGLRHPLLGSHYSEQKEILRSEYEIKEKDKNRAILISENLLLLRKQYIAYWAAQEKQLLTGEFLNDEEDLTQALEYRKEAGLLLESDRLEFMSAISLVHRMAQEQIAIQRRALGFLGHITGQTLVPFKAVFPQMETPCTDAKEMEDLILSNHPRLQAIREKITQQEELIRLTDRQNLDGHIELVGRVSTEAPDSESGYGVYLNVQFDFPWNAKKAISAKRRIERNVLDQLKQQTVITESSLLIEAHDALQIYGTANSNIEFARRRLSAAQERVRENLLRLAYLPGDVIEKLQQSRIEALRAALDLVEAQSQLLVQQAVLLSYADSTSPSDQGLEKDKTAPRYYPETSWEEAVKAINKPGIFHGLTFYVWDTQDLPFDSDTQGQWFENITRLGVRRLLLSFTTQQINAMQNLHQRQSIVQFIDAARDHGIRVEWLLGDPSWILPEHRDSLTELIRSFTDIPFQGIHLDLEPDQLTFAEHESEWLLGRLCETVTAVKSSTALPVGLSMHYRYLQDTSTGSFLASSFDKSALDEIILMIYITDTRRVSQIAGSIIEQYPRLTFSIAQSVEPILSTAESYHDIARKDFLLKLTTLSEQLQYKYFGSLVVQDWQSFLEMSP